MSNSVQDCERLYYNVYFGNCYVMWLLWCMCTRRWRSITGWWRGDWRRQIRVFWQCTCICQDTEESDSQAENFLLLLWSADVRQAQVWVVLSIRPTRCSLLILHVWKLLMYIYWKLLILWLSVKSVNFNKNIYI